jgi:hypothetical protein
MGEPHVHTHTHAHTPWPVFCLYLLFVTSFVWVQNTNYQHEARISALERTIHDASTVSVPAHYQTRAYAAAAQSTRTRAYAEPQPQPQPQPPDQAPGQTRYRDQDQDLSSAREFAASGRSLKGNYVAANSDPVACGITCRFIRGGAGAVGPPGPQGDTGATGTPGTPYINGGYPEYANVFTQGGNNFSSAGVLGTTNELPLLVVTNNVTRVRVGSNATTIFGGLNLNATVLVKTVVGSAPWVFTLPPTPGLPGQGLVTDGTGSTTWANFTVGVLPRLETMDIGRCAPFAILSGTSVTFAAGNTIGSGSVGVSPGTAIAGDPSYGDGAPHSNDQAAKDCASDSVGTDLAGSARACVVLAAAELGGVVLQPGVYCSPTGTFTLAAYTTLTFDARGNIAGEWIFQASTTLATTAQSNMALQNKAIADNIYWCLGTSAAIGASTIFLGNVLAGTSITVAANARVSGRLLGQTAVTLAAGVLTSIP